MNRRARRLMRDARRRADQRVWGAMTDAERRIVRAFDVPPAAARPEPAALAAHTRRDRTRVRTLARRAR